MPSVPPVPPAAPTSPLAQQLLDAQVAHHLERLTTAEHAGETLGRLTRGVLAASGQHRLDDLVDPDVVTAVVTRSLVTVPGSPAVAEIVDLVLDVVLEETGGDATVGDLADRALVEELVDQLLTLTPVLDRVLEQLTASPLVGTMAARFMGRVVGEALAANKSVADKVPGLGSLVSFGTSAATRFVGAADKQLEGLLGDTVGRGGTYAVRRLNRILLDTLRDPTTREALLEVWDLVADQPVTGLGAVASREELVGPVGAGHRLAVGLTATEPAARFSAAVVAAFFARFGDRTPLELLEELGISQGDLVTDVQALAPPVLLAMRGSGDLERLLRAELAPFYESAAVRDLLEQTAASGPATTEGGGS